VDAGRGGLVGLRGILGRVGVVTVRVVALSEDEHSGDALVPGAPMARSAIEFACGAWTALMILMPSATESKSPVNFEFRSQMRT
jgi:hypothetical protein